MRATRGLGGRALDAQRRALPRTRRYAEDGKSLAPRVDGRSRAARANASGGDHDRQKNQREKCQPHVEAIGAGGTGGSGNSRQICHSSSLSTFNGRNARTVSQTLTKT